MTTELDDLLAQGQHQLAACAWQPAAATFAAALELDDAEPRALDGYGEAVYWQQRYREAFAHRQRAYTAFRDRGELRAAALVAVRLAQWHGLVHGNAAALNGWLGHARRLVQECGDCPEAGWVELFRGCIAGDPAERERRTRAAAAVGRRFGVPALEFDALSYVGKARVEQGAVAEGMDLIDEAVAAVQGGLVTDPWAAGEIWCVLFDACELTVDVTRAEGWLDAVEGYVEHTGELPIRGICRMHLGGLLTSAGRWDRAEGELRAALAIYDETYTGTRHEPALRLAELHARQGRFEEAEQLLAGHEDDPAAAPARARVLAARGDLELATTVLDRALGPGPHALQAVPALALAVDLAVAREDLAAARDRATALRLLADATDLPAVDGLARRAEGRIAVAAGATDEAVAALESALSVLARAELAHEVAATRLDLAQLLAEPAPRIAIGEARTALASFQRLHARRDADAAAALLRTLGERATSALRVPHEAGGVADLTPRQAEVLGLVAEGLSNAQIAERLVISHRTVEDHVSNILTALGASSRTEAAAHVLRHGPTTS